jgi:hypothetical protein
LLAACGLRREVNEFDFQSAGRLYYVDGATVVSPASGSLADRRLALSRSLKLGAAIATLEIDAIIAAHSLNNYVGVFGI